MKTRDSNAFTLVELLVVIAIIGILVGVTLPAVQQVREAARKTDCLNNLRQLGLATHAFHDSQGAFPPSRLSGLPGANQLDEGPESWFVRVLPYVEQTSLFELWDLSIPYEQQVSQAISTPIDLFLCSSRHTVSDATASDTIVSIGAGG